MRSPRSSRTDRLRRVPAEGARPRSAWVQMTMIGNGPDVPVMTQPALHRGAPQDSKDAMAGGIAILPRDSQAKSGMFASMGAGATLHPAQRSPCYVVQDR